MSRRVWPPAVSFALLAFGCSRPQAGRLADALRRAAAEPRACGAIVPLEWASGWPVPTSASQFAVFYYPVQNGRPYAPAARASVPLSGPAACRGIHAPTAPLDGPRWTAEAAALDTKEWTRRSDELLDLTQRLAPLYAAGGPPSAQTRRLAADYELAFSALSEPALKPYYEALNPSFWAWLRATNASGSRAAEIPL